MSDNTNVRDNNELNPAPAAAYSAKDHFMQVAIEEARTGIHNNHGGPFGSVVVKDGKIVGQGHNMVLINNDSTAHGEMTAIRNAEASLGTYDLSGCVIYSTAEPCPMCLIACKWANIDKVYYGCTIDDNARIGFRDKMFREMFSASKEFSGYLEQTDHDACLRLFDEYIDTDKTLY